MNRAPLLLSLLLAALLAACAQTTGVGIAEPGGSRPGSPQMVEIVAAHDAFNPDTVSVESGEPVQATVKNDTDTEQNFTVKDTQGRLAAAIDVPPHSSRTLTFTPAVPGHYPFYSDTAGPAALGMRGEFVADGGPRRD